jgi:hypothetical protein
MYDPDDIINDDIPCMADECNEQDQFLTDAEADADALASAGYGTDEDYGCCCGGDE